MWSSPHGLAAAAVGLQDSALGVHLKDALLDVASSSKVPMVFGECTVFVRRSADDTSSSSLTLCYVSW
jgi:hypothetical protein